jgi:hypothetical protein
LARFYQSGHSVHYCGVIVLFPGISALGNNGT